MSDTEDTHDSSSVVVDDGAAPDSSDETAALLLRRRGIPSVSPAAPSSSAKRSVLTSPPSLTLIVRNPMCYLSTAIVALCLLYLFAWRALNVGTAPVVTTSGSLVSPARPETFSRKQILLLRGHSTESSSPTDKLVFEFDALVSDCVSENTNDVVRPLGLSAVANAMDCARKCLEHPSKSCGGFNLVHRGDMVLCDLKRECSGPIGSQVAGFGRSSICLHSLGDGLTSCGYRIRGSS